MPPKKQRLIKFIFSSVLILCCINNNFILAVKREKPDKSSKQIFFENKFQQLQSIPQKDLWQCGYFAVCNGCWLVEFTLEISPQISAIATKTFENWKKTVLNRWRALQKIQEKKILPTPPKNEEKLGGIHIEHLINLCFDPKISFFDMSNDNRDFNVSIIESNQFDEDKIYPENYIYKNIRNFRIFNIPQLIIINLGNHWITCLLMPDKMMYGMNSFNEDNLTDYPLVKQIYNHFVHTELPLGDNYLEEIKQIRKEKRARL